MLEEHAKIALDELARSLGDRILVYQDITSLVDRKILYQHLTDLTRLPPALLSKLAASGLQHIYLGAGSVADFPGYEYVASA